MGELMRAMDQILKADKKDLNKNELVVREALEIEQMRQATDDSAHVAKPQKIEVAHSAQLFKLPDGSSGGSIEVVILGAIITRANYVSREADSGVYCQSIGGRVGNPGEAGYAKLADEMPNLRDMIVLCAKCPFGANSFGTDGAGKKCKEMRKLLVFHKSNNKPLLLSVPPTSLQNFDQYYDSVDSAGKVMASIWTKITLKERRKGQQISSTFTFEAGPMLPSDQFLAGVKLREQYQDAIRSVDAGDYYQAQSTDVEVPTPIDTVFTPEEEDELPF